MPKPLIPTLLAILSLSTLFLPVYGQEEAIPPSRYSQTVYFRFDRTDIDSTYAGNHAALNTLHTLFTDSFHISFIDSIHIYAYSSPEGREAYNIKLSDQRASTMKKYLTDNYPLLSALPLSLIPGGENWKGLQTLVSADTCFNEREEVLMILDKVHDLTRRERLLKRLNGGSAYGYMQQHIFPPLRNAMVCTVRMNNRLKPAILSSRQIKPVSEMAEASGILSLIAARQAKVDTDTTQYSKLTTKPTVYFTIPLSRRISNPPNTQDAPPNTHTLSASVYSVRAETKRYSALKTNLAAWATTAVNLAYEVQIGKRFSLDLPVMWSSWDLARTPALRIFLFQPELRYWLSRPGQRHFFGLHVHVARYNLKWEEYRYQDTDYPLWGAGLSYGYALPLTDRWGMEFNFGVGYANSRYDTYRNVSNGALSDTRLLHYWGITRLGLSFIYKLSKP